MSGENLVSRYVQAEHRVLTDGSLCTLNTCISQKHIPGRASNAKSRAGKITSLEITVALLVSYSELISSSIEPILQSLKLGYPCRYGCASGLA